MWKDRENPEVISRLSVLSFCGGQDREKKREILSIKDLRGGWRRGISRELK